MSFFAELTRLAQSRLRTVVLAEAADERVVRAAQILKSQQIAHPVLTGVRNDIEAIADKHNVCLDGIRIVDPAQDTENLARYIKECANLRRPLVQQAAEDLMARCLMFSAMMVRLGDADAMIAGASVPTAHVLAAGLKVIGTQPGISTASSYLLMLVPAVGAQPARTLFFSDCAFNIEPTPEQLSEITISTAQNVERILGRAPRIAMLSFSTHGSAQHPFIDKVTAALDLVQTKRPEIQVDGELQFDAAIEPQVADFKLARPSNVAGQADVFIFPDLNAGNIGYKIAQYLAGAQAVGPILQGFANPISDLSRGASVDDVVKTTIVLLATTANR